MKQNDWIVATLNNPTFTVGDFQNIADMTLDNTQFLSRDEYLKSDFIRQNDAFKDKNGEFSEDLFNQFYQDQANRFQQFSTEDIVNNYEYSIWDVNRPDNSQVKNTNFSISVIKNPEHIKIGIEGINKVTLSDQSRRELAQNSKIYDPATGQYLDKSVNDISLFSNPVEYFKSWFDEPLVYATYDEDTTEIDPITGREIKHVKGEWKLNDEGEYYTERLNGRSLIGKQVVSVEDYITPESSAFNKYDFMDSDGLDKSPIGSIAKNLVAALPIFIPYVGEAYAGLLIGREMAKTIPMMYGIANGLSGEDSRDDKLLNTLSAYGQKFTGSTSDYAQENTFSLENFLNLASDIPIQWGQQNLIANTFSKLTSGGKKALDEAFKKAGDKYLKEANNAFSKRFQGKITDDQLIQEVGTNSAGAVRELIQSGGWTNTLIGKAAISQYLPTAQKIFDNRMRAGQDLSLVYMALISNTDVYESVLEKGGTPLEAAAIALGSIMGMFSVDRFGHLGEMFFQKSGARWAFRESARHNAELYMAGRNTITNESTKEGIINTIKKGIADGRKTVNDYFDKVQYGGLSLVGKSLGEGLEEVSEELVADASKQIGELLGHLGYFSQTDYGAWENAFDRYAMSFLGGSVGGAMYGVKEAWQNRNADTKQFQNDINYLIKQGHKNDLIKEFKKLRDSGELGSKTLSYIPATDGSGTYLTANENRKSQAQSNYEGLVNIVNQLDLILNQNDLNLSEDEVFDKLVQGEYRNQALTDFLNGDNIANVKEASYISRYQEDLANLTTAIENKDLEIQELINSTTDAAQRGNPKFKQDLEKLQQEKQQLLDERDFLFGEGSLGYVEKTLFAMDPVLNRNFGIFNFNQFVRYKFNKSTAELDDAELAKANEDFKKLDIKTNLDQAFKLFKQMGNQINPSIQNLSNLNVNQEIKNIEELRENNPFNKILPDNAKLDSESDEEYAKLFIKQDGESDEDLLKRQQEHRKKVEEYNLDHIYKWIQDFLQKPITSTDFRYIVGNIRAVKSQILNNRLNGIVFPGNNELTQDIRGIISRIGINDTDKLYTAIHDRIAKAVNDYYNTNYDGKVNVDQDQDTQEKVIEPVLQQIQELSPEERVGIGVPENYTYTEGIVTNKDLYAYIKYLKAQNKTDDEIRNILDTLNWNADEDINNAIDFYDRASENSNLLNSKEANNILAIDLSLVNNDIEQKYNDFKLQLDNNFIQPLQNDEVYKTLTDLENSQFINNPVIPILEQVSKQSPNKDVNIEKFLQDIYETFSKNDTYQDFQLSGEQLRILNQMQQDLETAAAFVYAASKDPSKSIGHNTQINQFANNHKDVFSNYQNLPEIDSNIANFLLGELAAYKREIQQWIRVHESNSQELELKFFKAGQALSTGLTEYFKVYRDSFKLDDGTDLLDGYENLTLDNSLSSVISLQELLYNNYNKAISNGYTLGKVLDKILPKMTKLEGILSQKTAKLDENFTYGNLTDYDKFQLFISSIASSSINYYQNLYKFLQSNQNMAPISIQEYVSKLSYAQNQNPELINKALEYIKDKTGIKLDIAYNTQIVSGLGGTGKTFAVARLNLGEGENTWLSGPEQSQVDNLLQSLPKGTGITKEEIFKTIFGGTIPDLSTVYTKVKNGKITTVALKPEFTPKTIQNPPKTLVFDEATHLSTAEVLILSKFCKQNNINLVLIGDFHQNGYNQNNLNNIEVNTLLAWRAPDLYLSLRNANVHKVENQKPIINMLDTLGDAPDSSFESVSEKVYNEQFKRLVLKYYNKEELSGDILVNNLSNDLLNKIPKDSVLGFVGTDQSPYYKQLKDAGYDVKVMSPTQVQGQEFDYVVVDRPWNFNKNELWYNTGVDMIDFLRDLYTMISRSRKATILIDNGLSKYVNNIESNYNGTLSAISKSVDKFRSRRLPEIEEALQKVANLKATNNETQGEQPVSNIVRKTQYTSRNGTTVNGQYTSTVDNDGFTHIDYDGQSQAKIHFSNDDVGLTIEDITGPRDGYDTEENWNDIKTDVGNGNITINKVTVRPDNSVSIETDNGITIEGEPAKKIYDFFFKEGLPIYTRNVNKQSIKIGGETITQQDLESETQPDKTDSESNNEEQTESDNNQNTNEWNIGSPITVYSNVSYSGIDNTQEVWTNEEDSKTDLGIFIRPGERVEPGNKDKLVRKVIELKNIFEYGIDGWDALDLDTKRRFSEDSFKNAKYFVKIEDVTNFNRLIGLTEGTGLTNENRPINGKVVKLIAKITGNDGVEYTLSLGGLNNPDTWEANRNTIEEAIQSRINRNEGDVEAITEYKNSLKDIIVRYRNRINLWTQQNQEIELKNPPVFHGDTLIRTLDNYYRLENINDTYSPYKSKASIQVVSPIYANVGEIEGINPKLRGKPIRFISRDILLSPSKLKDIYLQQLENPNLPKRVRMDVLSNLGVSFKSLQQSKYRDLYKITNGNTIFTLPFETGPMAVRMYIAMWNFRAGLNRFLDSYKSFKEGANLSDQQIEDLCKLDNQQYDEFRKESEVVDEASYRKSVPKELASKLKLIWDFNDSLATYCKEFRLGYSSGHGAYLRKLTNLDSKFYENPDSVVGVYINPDIARQYQATLDLLFNNVINKIIPTTQQNTSKYITTKLSDLDNWFDNIKDTSEIKLTFNGRDKNEDITISVKDMSVLHALPPILVRTAYLLNIYNQNVTDLEEYLRENDDSRYQLAFNGEALDWMGILKGIDNPVEVARDEEFKYQGPGIIPLETKNGVKMGIKDSRLDDMFSLMFHGMISTKIPNDFTRGDIRATYAYFKYGFFVDPLIQALSKNGEKQNIEYVITNPKFFASNLSSAGTIISIDLDTETTEQVNQPVQRQPQQNPVIQLHSQVSSQLQAGGINISDKVLQKNNTIEDYIDLVQSRVSKEFNNFFLGQSNIPIENLIESVTYQNGQLAFNRFVDRPELQGQSITNVERNTDSIIITLENGNQYIVQNVAGNMILTPMSEPKDIVLQVGPIKNEIISVLDKYTEDKVEDGISNDGNFSFYDELMQILDNNLGTNNDDTVSTENLNDTITLIQNKLEEYEGSDWYDTIISELTNYKNRICSNT